jgi:hypothetical protein
MRYEYAVETLFQVPLEQFVAERKRLASELKTAGDKDGAARLARLTRPPISAWVVDQLWWRARSAFVALFEAAERVRRGDFGASAAHRDAIAALRAQATRILNDARHGATEATLRRVTQTLSALAAAGDWAPDTPGALTADRDPPGFEAIGISNVIPFPIQRRLASEPGGPDSASASTDTDTTTAVRESREADEIRRRRDREAAAARAEAAADLRRAETERARAAAERHRLEAALRTAQGDIAQREREVVRLERDLATARNMVTQARAVVAGLEERLAQLDN